MAAETIKDAVVSIGGVDLSSLVKSVTLKPVVEAKETTGFGADAKTRAAGLKDITLDIDWYGDYAASSVYATIEPLIGTSAAYSIAKDSGTTAATNPTWTGNCIITEFPLIDAKHGEVHEFSTSWPGNGDYTETTS